MKLPFDYAGKVENLCSKDDGRYVLTHLYLDVSRSLLCGTDGHILGCIPVTIEEGETAGLIPAEALKRMIAGLKREPTIHCGEQVVLRFSDGECITYPRPTGQFPDLTASLPRPVGPPTITLNPHLLKALAQAVSSGGSLDIWIRGPLEGILVSGGLDKYRAFGVLMPQRSGTVAPPVMPPAPKKKKAA